MKVIELAAPSVDSLRSCTYPDPVPGPGDVLLRLRAASLNFLDIAVATGKYPLNNFPIIPVTDGAGEIAAVGSAATEWKVGERVMPHFIPDWQDGRMPTAGGGPRRDIDLPGSLAEYVVVPAQSLVRTPAQALVLGTGGVSLFAVQFAKAHRARVIVTSSSDEKLHRARKLGADEVVNYKSTPEWAERCFA